MNLSRLSNGLITPAWYERRKGDPSSYAQNDRPSLGLRSTYSVIFVQGVGVKNGPNDLPRYLEQFHSASLLTISDRLQPP